MSHIILVFGILILIVGAIILVKPDTIFGLLRRHAESIGIHVLAVVVRLILGVALVTYAAESNYPIALKIIGWLSLTAALILGVIGRSRFKSLMNWAMNLVSPYGRAGGFLTVLFWRLSYLCGGLD